MHGTSRDVYFVVVNDEISAILYRLYFGEIQTCRIDNNATKLSKTKPTQENLKDRILPTATLNLNNFL